MKRYSTINNWVKYFEKHEGVYVSNVTILRRLKEAGKIGKTARSSVGRVLKNAFYSESDVRSACGNLLKKIPQANEDGFFELEGVKYGTCIAWSRILPISTMIIIPRLKKAKKQGIQGKGRMGQVYNFYSESDVFEVCADHLKEEFFVADDEGFFEKNEEKFGTIVAWGRFFGITGKVITRLVKQFSKTGIKGKDKLGHIWMFYSESDVREICTDYLDKDLPQANKRGFFEKDGKQHRTAEAWSGLLPISAIAIINRLEKNKIKGVKGKSKNGQIYMFYSKPDILEICSDLLEDLPRADENGFFEKDSIKYGFVYAWSQTLSISRASIIIRLKKFGKQGIKGKNKMGLTFDFYSEPDILSSCADILKKIPKADKSGFIKKDGIRYGTTPVLSKALGVSKGVIIRIIKASSIPSIKGKDGAGGTRDYYPEPEIMDFYITDLPRAIPQADESGFFEKDGMKYGTIGSWTRVLRIPRKIITRSLKDAGKHGIEGRGKSGYNRFYSEPDIHEVCGDLLGQILQADENGFFEKGKIKYALIKTWSKYFKEKERIWISRTSIRNKLFEAGKIGITAKNSAGRVLINAFCSETDVREVCKDLLEQMPQVNEDGFFELNGVKYAPYYVWAEILGISSGSIRKRLSKIKKQGIEGKARDGRNHIFYSESDVRSACADLLDENLLQANEDGFFEINKEKYGTILAWAKVFPISLSELNRRVKKAKKQCIKGKAYGGQIRNFYTESIIREVCADLLDENLPQADEGGFFELDGKKYGMIYCWSKVLSISKSAIGYRLKKFKKQSIRGKGLRGQIFNFYSEPDVRSACADLLENDLLHADKDNFFEKDGKKYGTINAWSKNLMISSTPIISRLEKAQMQGIKGKDKGGRVCDFYLESDVRFVCTDILQDLHQADENGFFEQADEKYGTTEAWSRVLPISQPLIRTRLKKSRIQSIKGKLRGGQIHNFYPEPAVRQACADLLEKRNKSNS